MNTCPGLTIVTSPSSLGSDTYTKEEEEEEEEREVQSNVQSRPTGNIQTAEKPNYFAVQRDIPWVRSRCSALEQPIGAKGSPVAALTLCRG